MLRKNKRCTNVFIFSINFKDLILNTLNKKQKTNKTEYTCTKAKNWVPDVSRVFDIDIFIHVSEMCVSLSLLCVYISFLTRHKCHSNEKNRMHTYQQNQSTVKR